MQEKTPITIYHVLARGVIIKDFHLLVAHCKGMDNTFLPGGHVERFGPKVKATSRSY